MARKMSSIEHYSTEDSTVSKINCIVCLTDIDFSKNDYIKLDCFHTHCFHKKCLGKTAYCCRNHNCPLCKRPYDPSIIGDTNITYTHNIPSSHSLSNTHNNNQDYDYDDDDNSDYDDTLEGRDDTLEEQYNVYDNYFDKYLERDIIDYGVVMPENNGWEDYGRTRNMYWEDDV